MRRTGTSRIPHRRRREGKTDYKLRLKLLKSGKKRLVVRKFNNNLTCQVVEHHPKGDRTVFHAEARELRRFGWKAGLGNIPAAYLTGLLCGVRARGGECVLDLGLQTSSKGSRLYAALKGAADGGVKIPFSEDNVPAPERISGKHVAEPKDLPRSFEDAKGKIVKSGGKLPGKEDAALKVKNAPGRAKKAAEKPKVKKIKKTAAKKKTA
jgi:large subunit ribosomal protein L18